MGWSPRCYIPSFVKIGPPVLEKKVFERVFTIYGRGGHLGHVTKMPRTKFRPPPYPRRGSIKFGFDWPIGFGEEDLWALWRTDDDDGRRTDDGRTPDHEYPISSPMSLRFRWANNWTVQVTWTKWPPRPYTVKTYRTRRPMILKLFNLW